MLTAGGLVLIGAVRIASGISAEALFGVAGLAFVTAAISVATLATIVGGAGLSAGITKLIAELRGLGHTARADSFAALTARAVLGLTLVGAAGAALYSLADERLAGGGGVIVTSVAALTFSFGMYQAGKAIAYGEERIPRYLGAEALGAILFGVALTAVAVLDLREGIVVPLIVAYLPVAWIGASRLGKPASGSGPLPIRSLAGYGVIGSVGSLAGIGFTRATPLVAGFLAGTPGTALVGAALFVLEPLYLAPRAISLTLLPNLSFASAAGNRTQSGEVVRLSTGITALLTAPFCAILILERDRVLQVVFSDEIVGGATLAWFSAAFLVSVIGAPAITALAAVRVRSAAIPMWSSLVGFLIAALIWVTVGSREGTVAVAIGYLVGSIVQVAYPLVAATRLYQIHWTGFWLRMLVLAAALVAGSRITPSVYLDLACVALILLILFPETRRLLQHMRARLVR